MNRIVELRKVCVHEVRIITALNTVYTDDTIEFNIDAFQSVNYQTAKYRLHGSDLDKMLDEIIERAKNFKEMTDKGFGCKGVVG